MFPDGVGPGSEDVATTDIIVLHHLRLGDHLTHRISLITPSPFTPHPLTPHPSLTDLGIPLRQILFLPTLQTQSIHTHQLGVHIITIDLPTHTFILHTHAIHLYMHCILHEVVGLTWSVSFWSRSLS